jgi:hypothetical protein
MKRCPACQRTYPDDQNFCFDDGTTLVNAPVDPLHSSEAPTADYQYRGSSLPTEQMHGAPTTSVRPARTSPPPPPPPAFLMPYPQKRSPMPWIVGGVLVLAIAIAAAIYLANRDSGGTTSSGSWETISDSGFSISMPGKPAKSDSTVPSAAGPLPLRMYTLSKGYEGYFTGYSEYPDIVFTASEPEEILNGAQQGAISNIKGEVTSQRSITIDGHPGREIVGTSPEQNIGFTARVYLAKPRIYMVVYTQYDKSKPVSADGKKYLDSFKLTK